MNPLPRKPRIAPAMALLAWVVLAWSDSAGAGPMVSPFPESVSTEGAAYAGILYLDDYVEDPEAADAALAWRVAESVHLDIEITKERHLVARSLDANWYGDEQVLLSVCSPLGECASQTASFRVEPTPDDPLIDWIPSQVVGEAAEFPLLDLAWFGSDPDGDSDLTWTVSGGTWLSPMLAGTALAVERRDPTWRGTEEIQLRLTDSTGRTAWRQVLYTVADGVPVSLTFVPNRPILIQCEDTRVLVDGLLHDFVALSSREKERLDRAEPPFDGIDLALTTHEHFDHVTPRVAVDYLMHSPSTLFVSLPETVDLLSEVPGFSSVADRAFVIPFVEGTTAEFDSPGVHVTAFPVRHSGAGNNLAFLVEIGGIRILLVGDGAFDLTPAELAAYAWPSLSIDVAVLPPRWVEVSDGALVTQSIAPRFVISSPLRQCPPRLAAAAGGTVPEVVCESVETWVVPPRAASADE
jgi:L-ascorbate metabolism protein UlaG (beta-lactamase superfamily)